MFISTYFNSTTNDQTYERNMYRHALLLSNNAELHEHDVAALKRKEEEFLYGQIVSSANIITITSLLPGQPLRNPIIQHLTTSTNSGINYMWRRYLCKCTWVNWSYIDMVFPIHACSYYCDLITLFYSRKFRTWCSAWDINAMSRFFLILLLLESRSRKVHVQCSLVQCDIAFQILLL